MYLIQLKTGNKDHHSKQKAHGRTVVTLLFQPTETFSLLFSVIQLPDNEIEYTNKSYAYMK